MFDVWDKWIKHISDEASSFCVDHFEASRGCPGVPVHGGIPIVFISIHGVVTQFVNVSFLCVPVHKDTTGFNNPRTPGHFNFLSHGPKLRSDAPLNIERFFV